MKTYSPSSCAIRASKVALLRGSFLACLPAIASISSTNTKQGACRKIKNNHYLKTPFTFTG